MYLSGFSRGTKPIEYKDRNRYYLAYNKIVMSCSYLRAKNLVDAQFLRLGTLAVGAVPEIVLYWRG